MRRLLFLPLLALACGTSSSGAPIAPASTDAGDAAPPRTAECLAQDTKVQAGLDGARKSPNALLAVKNEACGTSVYVSGDPQYATATSLFRVGSVTKTFVSAVILNLVRDGKVSLDDPLEKWVPGVPSTTGVTVRMLLNHTSGIFNYTEVPAFLVDRKKVWAPSDLVALVAAQPPYFAPGAGWHYSNTNYILLGMIAEKAGGAKISALIRARDLVPAGLTHTFFDGEEPLDGTLARGFSASNKDVTTINDMSGPWAAGAIAATGADLVEWAATLYGTSAVLDDASRALMTAGAVSAGSGATYGLGVLILAPAVTDGAGEGIGHDGAIDGFYTQAFYFRDRKTAIVAFTNQDGTSPNDLMLAALGALFH